jgi:hypothetical protein
LKSHSTEGGTVEKKLNRRCGYCGQIGVAGVDVFWEVDPYTREVSGEVVKDWYHVECLNDLALSI